MEVGLHPNVLQKSFILLMVFLCKILINQVGPRPDLEVEERLKAATQYLSTRKQSPSAKGSGLE